MIQIDNVSKHYGTFQVLTDCSTMVTKGEVVVVCGPSGSGKSTLIKCVNGLEPFQQGRILVDGTSVGDPATHLPRLRSRVGMVFQHFELFPHLSVSDNLTLAQRHVLGRDKEAATAKAMALLDRVGLKAHAAKSPNQLSGGQQQRVALARALAPQPEVLLLDEPFSNLDVSLRERLAGEVRDILKATQTTAVMVTHDQHEAFAVADVVGVLAEGRLQQWDTAYALYHQPANRFVADFVGQGAFVHAHVLDAQRLRLQIGEVQGEDAVFATNQALDFAPGTTVEVLLRPDDVLHDDASPVQARVVHKAFKGAEFLYTLALADGTRLLSLVPSHHDHAIGEAIGIRLDVSHVVAFQRA